MSSRALRKLQGEVALGGGEKGEDDGASGEESPPSRGGQAFNAFSLVGNTWWFFVESFETKCIGEFGQGYPILSSTP